ncbi:lytic transglycosylase domain-containing protein [Psychrobacter sp. 230]|uniref:lytic transglycosylase domain-containing protein n=1 Tax=Psychrobacter sp. 230 TaxID=2555884 RepID=UPI0010677616|nr:lytic transglycosylase domain-containing protein [Psychrobacter sp. 230]TEW87179.1 hypothetical protein E2545_06300 [Psychrobacter sp. 230]|tara:strand:- start:23925 stop:27146 length:3222 start_codon:yes stop_codon:yes gene_type:complete
MATTSLGRLTLDLAVRLSEFSEGLSRAERETQERTRQMGESVSNFRQRVMDELGGTQIGGVIDSLNERFGALSGGGLAAGGAIAGMAVGGIAVAAGALTAMALETAKADVELQIMANTANTGLKSFQVLTYASAQLGVEQDALAGILADTQEKLGEFSATGGGGAADFFEALQNNTEMTDEQIRELGKTLQGKDGAEAIQLVKDKMDALGATSQEQRFVFESLAGDLGNLMPLFANGGAILNEYGKELEDAGVIKTKESIEQSRRLTAQTQAIQTRFEGFKTQLSVQMMPVLNSLIGYFVSGDSKGSKFGSTMESVGFIAKSVGAGIIAVATGVKLLVRMIQAFGEQVANIGITSDNFLNAEGFMAKARALKAGASSVYDINARLGVETVGILSDAKAAMAGMFEPATKELTGLAGALYKTNGELDRSTTGLRTNTVEAEANAKAIEAREKALAKAQKTAGSASLKPNAKALANAENYGFANYEAQYGLPQGLMTGIHMQESHGNTKATGPNTKYGTAKGGFQLIDATAERFKVDNAYNMEQATEGAAKYLSYLYKRFDGDLVKTIAAYNTGEGNVDKNPMSLILSDRWARNKKTGIGQTKEYTKNVLAYMKSATTDTSKLVYDTVTKQAQDAQKLQEETLRRQQSIQSKYANEREKLDRDYIADIAEIESLYAEGSIERTKLLGRAKTEYEEKRQAKAKSILESYMSDEVKLAYEHNKKIDAINIEFAHDDTTREMLIDLQKAAYEEDLANFKFTAEAKARAQDKMYQSIANSARAGSANAFSTGKDSMMQRTLSDEDYQQWRLNQDYVEGFTSINNDYKNREEEINAVDERGNDAFPELERFELLEIAKQEHLDKMWALEQEYALKDQTLAEQQTSQRIAMYQSLFSGISGLAKAFAGEQSAAYRVSFAIEKGFAIAQSVMAIQQAVAKAMAVGFPANIPLIAQSVAQGAQVISSIKSVQAPAVAGIAHGGLENVPEEATYLLQKDERVLSPKQNKDLVKFMANSQKASAGNITINNNSKAEVSARQNPDGTVTVDMVDKMIEKSFKRIGRANSIESKSIQRGTTARVNRR